MVLAYQDADDTIVSRRIRRPPERFATWWLGARLVIEHRSSTTGVKDGLRGQNVQAQELQHRSPQPTTGRPESTRVKPARVLGRRK